MARVRLGAPPSIGGVARRLAGARRAGARGGAHTRGVDVVAELLAAIGAQPDDPDPQLVLADHLLSAGDPRGELIVLDHLERSAPGGLTEPEAIERLLVLAATYGFPCARDEVEPMLPFESVDEYGGRDELHHGGRRYIVGYGTGSLYVWVVDEGDDFDGNPEEYRPELAALLLDAPDSFSGHWNDEERDVVLTLLSDAIRAGTPLSDLQIPYVGEPLPQYPGAPLRAYWLPESFVAAHGLSRDRHGLPARDYHRWHALWERLQRLPPPER
jgi:uncharacterized protein (TIGR02996 family)